MLAEKNSDGSWSDYIFANVQRIDSATTQGEWMERTVDLSAYAGKTVKLRFLGRSRSDRKGPIPSSPSIAAQARLRQPAEWMDFCAESPSHPSPSDHRT